MQNPLPEIPPKQSDRREFDHLPRLFESPWSSLVPEMWQLPDRSNDSGGNGGIPLY
jgi:hypothetical protein